MSKNCKLFETLTKCNSKVDAKHQPKDYNCLESCPFFSECFYEADCDPKEKYLQGFFGGWQKYVVYKFTKRCEIDGHYISKILHLINPTRVDDIVIFRVLKKNKDDNNYKLRYICKQGAKSHICSNLNEANNYIGKHYEYNGRQITSEDF